MTASFSISNKESITIFTDGSCHAQLKTGGWASIIFVDSQKIILEGRDSMTTHQRMELTAVLEAIKYLKGCDRSNAEVVIYSDSQYVVDLVKRKATLVSSNYRTKKFKQVRNTDLVKELIELMGQLSIRFVKIKAHQKLSDLESKLNREVDLLSRKNMRQS